MGERWRGRALPFFSLTSFFPTHTPDPGSSASLVGAVATYRRVGGASDSPPLASTPVKGGGTPSQSGASTPAQASPPPPPASRPRAVLRALLLIGAAAALVHGASCGALYCGTGVPARGGGGGRGGAHAGVAALHSLRGECVLEWVERGWNTCEGVAQSTPLTPPPHLGTGAPPAAAAALPATPPHPHPPIPRVIHQTYRSLDAVPPAAAALMRTWRAVNPGWETRFWSDADCSAFVASEFPEYASAYAALPKHVERADFFRYLVVLKHGGVYADVDTECRTPLDSILSPKDTLVVGWENEFATAPLAARRKYVRKRQVLQWVFAGAPGHPALRAVCDHIATHARSTLATQPNFDTLERTGPGAFTDAVLAAADAHPPRRGGGADAPVDLWSVRFLPKIMLGAHPRALDAVQPDDARVAVLHHYLGTWKSKLGWAGGGVVGAAAAALSRGGAVAGATPAAPGYEPALPRDRAGARFYPVSLATTPPVTIMVPLVGAGEAVAGRDAAAGVTVYGAWAPAGPPPPGAPTPVDALLAALDADAVASAAAGVGRGVLLDVGAGVGAAAIAAAARGARVVATEAGPVLAAALRSSVAYNGLAASVDVKEVVVGGPRAAGAACVGASAPRVVPRGTRGDIARGYGWPAGGVPPTACNATSPRVAAADVAPPRARVAAVRVSAPGAEASIVAGLEPLLTSSHPPRALLLEVDAGALDAGASGDAATTTTPPSAALFTRLAALGYSRHASHSGPACAARWAALAKALRLPTPPRRAGRAPASVDGAAPSDLAPPPWCALGGEGDVAVMLAAARRGGQVETVLLLHDGVESGGGGGGDVDADAP